MARSVALSVLRGRVREAGDFGPDTTSGRYPNTRLNTEINASWQRGREIANLEGDGQVYLKSAIATMTPGPVASASFGTISMPSDCVEIHGIDVQLSSNNIYSLQAVPFGDRNAFCSAWGGLTGQPRGFFVLSTGVESGTSVSSGTVGIIPAPDLGYTYNMWYMPVWVDITGDTSVFNGIAGHEDWAMWDTVIKIATGDNDSQRVIDVAMAERAKAEELLTRRVNHIQRAAPMQRRDVARSRRRTETMLWRWRP